MKENFWKLLARPAFTLAPMEDVTDTVFREIVLHVSDPSCLHVLYSEFISTDGFCHETGGPKIKHRLVINETERELLTLKNVKIVAQIWGTNPEKFYQSAKVICNESKFDGIDINMGCPVRKIVKQGGCSALIAQPALAKEIFAATKEGSNVPVSIKTRIGIGKVITEEWISHLLECRPDLITVHGRTQKQQSNGLADWNEIRKAVALRNRLSPETLIHGNGDVSSVADGLAKAKDFGVDGVMIGRGIFHNPWFFNLHEPEKSRADKLDLLWRHTQLYTKTWGPDKKFVALKRFFKIYTSGFQGAHQLRAKLMKAGSAVDVKTLLEEFKS
ncbi:MAG: tRNA-dihydrouridine synthase [Bacteroidetes bacterium]|nr:tRNA-dihydrouridine synthase [Bacteroidota bacterium]